jgi:hypothetical protein
MSLEEDGLADWCHVINHFATTHQPFPSGWWASAKLNHVFNRCAKLDWGAKHLIKIIEIRILPKSFSMNLS